jgi:hypothetical protein
MACRALLKVAALPPVPPAAASGAAGGGGSLMAAQQRSARTRLQLIADLVKVGCTIIALLNMEG